MMALLVGGPKHGEVVALEPGQHEYNCVRLGSPTRIGFPGNDELPPAPTISTRTERYRRMRETFGAWVVFEHESLWYANVQAAVERLDRELDAQKRISNEAKAASREAEERNGRAIAKIMELHDQREKLREEYGV